MKIFHYILFLSTFIALMTAVKRIPSKSRISFVRYLNIARTRIAIGFQKFQFNEKGKEEAIKYPSASKMMEVKWSDEAATIAESAMDDYCENATFVTYINPVKYQLAAQKFHAPGSNNVFDPDIIISVFFNMSDAAWPLFLAPEFVNSRNYSDFFSWSRVQIMTAKEEITEIGCSMAYCRGFSVNICAYSEVTCFSNCTVYTAGPTCSNCPDESKCTFDGLCSFREEATSNFTKISKSNQEKIIEKINESRSVIANGGWEISVNSKGEKENKKLPSAKNMMEVTWNDSSVGLAENKLSEWCKYGQQFSFDNQDKYVARSFSISMESVSRSSAIWDIPIDQYFIPSDEEWPLYLSSEDQNNETFFDIFQRDRFDMFLSWASIIYIGCAIEYCRGEIVTICAMGEFEDCSNGCSVYKQGPTCSSCPENSTCLEGIGLCTFQLPDEIETTHKSSNKFSIFKVSHFLFYFFFKLYL